LDVRNQFDRVLPQAAIAVCGAVLFVFSITGKLNLLRGFSTENIVVVLLLVALALSLAVIEMLTQKNHFSTFYFQ